ncbi:MAG: tetratricopeptide repeat protein [Rhodobacteraceae bacterium]|nr:tetratricopeptide repeat protein [Paracoccaceae bacterium]
MAHRQAPCVEKASCPARLSLLGPLRLSDANGHDRTPSSLQQQAILVILALSPDGKVSRARLQDLLWGEKSPQRAAQSLRTALHGLRRSLANFAVPLVEIDPNSVRLRREAVFIDVLEIERDGPAAIPSPCRAAPPDIAEGIDFRGQSGDEFEDWLRSQRSYWHDRIEALLAPEGAGPLPAPGAEHPAEAAATVPAIPAPKPETWRPVVGLLQPVIHSRSFQTLYFSEAVIDRIAAGLRDYLGATCYDYRDLAKDGEPGTTATRNPDLFLRLRVYEDSGQLSSRVLALRQSAQELLWTVDCSTVPASGASVDDAHVLGLLGQTIDRVAATLACRSRPSADTPLSPFHALTAMFQLDHSSLGALRTKLQDSLEATGEPVYRALMAYLNTFSVGEHWHPFDADLRDETRALLAGIVDTDCTSGITLALAGHATGYVLHDRDGADDLLDRAIRLGPHSALCWDHLALHRLYGAQYGAAHRAAEIALRMGAVSPIRFAQETTLSMICMLEGKFDIASALGKRILSRRPNYGAALRYTAVSLAQLGRTDEARDCIARIRDMDPAFSADWVGSSRMAIRDASARDILVRGLIRAGA